MAGDAREVMARVPIFAGIEPRQLDALLAVAVTRRFRARQVVIEKGDPPLSVYVIAKGRLKVITAALEGRQAALSIMGPGEIFGEVAVLDGQPRSATITALEACELLTVGRNEFLYFLEHTPEAAMRLLKVLASRLRRLSERVEDNAFLELQGRLARQLLRLAERYGTPVEGGIAIGLKLSQQELGDLVGAARESVNKQLRAWVSEGLIVQREGQLVLSDREALQALAEE